MVCCAVQGCKLRKRLHVFPIPFMRAMQWAFLSGRSDFTYSKRPTFRVCDKHFPPEMKVPMFRLDAFPCLHIPDPPLEKYLESASDIICSIADEPTDSSLTPLDEPNETTPEDANNAALSYHKFPGCHNAQIQSEWIEACGLNPNENISRLKICSKHFTVDDYIDVYARKFGGKLTLKPMSVPTTSKRQKPAQSIPVIFLPETPLTILTESWPVTTTENITNDVDFEVPVAPEYSDCTPMSPDPGDPTDFETQVRTQSHSSTIYNNIWSK